MYKYLYIMFLDRYRKTLKNKGFKYFSLYYNQINSNEIINYPAVMIEFPTINHKYLSNRILDSTIDVIFHITSESLADSRNKSLTQDKFFEHYDLVDKVNKAFNGYNSSNILLENLLKESPYFSFNNLNKVSSERVSGNKNIIYTKLTFRFKFYNNYYNSNQSLIKFNRLKNLGDNWLLSWEENFLLSDFSILDFTPDFA